MAAINFTDSTGKEISRKYLTTHINVGTQQAKVWELIGVKIQDSSIEYNSDSETVTDILGITTKQIKKIEATQTIEPFTLRGDSVLAEKLVDIMKRGAVEELSQFEVLVVYGFSGTTGSYDATLEIGCTIEVKSLGGSDRVEMPLEITFSNNKTHGTTNIYATTPTTPIVFTATV